MTASCSTLSQFSGPPLLNARPASVVRLSGRAHAPPDPINHLFHQVSDRFAAAVRLGRRAMIALTVRNERLIAPTTHTSISFPQEFETVIHGFHEDEPLCFERTTGARRGSAARVPQVCGQRRPLFAPEGMIDWLRRRFPQSTCHHIEAATGISAATVDNWLIRRSQPSVEHFTKLIAIFGPDLLRASLGRPPGWIDRAAAGERARQIDEEIARLRREREGLDA